MGSWTIARKLTVSMVVLVVLAVSILFAFASELKIQSDESKAGMVNGVAPLMDMADTMNLMQRARLNLRDAFIASQMGEAEEKVAAYRNTYRSISEQVDQFILKMQDQKMTSEASQFLKEGVAGWNELKVVVGKIETATLEKNYQLAAQLFMNDCFAASKKAVDGFNKFADQKQLELNQSIDENIETTKSFTWIGTLMALFVTAVSGWFATQTIAHMRKSLGQAIEVSKAIETGDFTKSIKSNSSDEVGQLLNNLNAMTKGLGGLINGIRNTTLTLADSSGSVRTSSDEMNIAASQQADATASMAAAVEQLTVSISQITENSNDASHTAMLAKQSADQGSITLNQVVEGIRGIAESVQGSAATVRSLEKQSNEISEIISTITDIADRTNLLALNAAIEAARAGESGRGFAVVADEVRKLAEQTKGSSERISSMVFQIQNITQEASKSMESSVGMVQHGIEQADAVAGTIDKIKANADSVNDAIQAITVSMKEQSNVSVEISRNVERVAQMTEENTAAIAQNKQVAQQISDLAANLTNSVQVFRT